MNEAITNVDWNSIKITGIAKYSIITNTFTQSKFYFIVNYGKEAHMSLQMRKQEKPLFEALEAQGYTEYEAEDIIEEILFTICSDACDPMDDGKYSYDVDEVIKILSQYNLGSEFVMPVLLLLL